MVQVHVFGESKHNLLGRTDVFPGIKNSRPNTNIKLTYSGNDSE